MEIFEKVKWVVYENKLKLNESRFSFSDCILLNVQYIPLLLPAKEKN